MRKTILKGIAFLLVVSCLVVSCTSEISMTNEDEIIYTEEDIFMMRLSGKKLYLDSDLMYRCEYRSDEIHGEYAVIFIREGKGNTSEVVVEDGIYKTSESEAGYVPVIRLGGWDNDGDAFKCHLLKVSAKIDLCGKEFTAQLNRIIAETGSVPCIQAF